MFHLPWCRTLAIGAFATFVVACCSWGAIFAEEQVIKLGGIRNVTATILKSDETYQITVSMLPVKAFDPATNKRLNLSKAQVFAARALAKHVGTGKSSGLIIRGLTVRESGASGELFRLVAVVPRNGVTLVAAQDSSAKDDAREPARQPLPSVQPAKQAVQAASDQHIIRVSADATVIDFLNRKADYLDTITQLQEAMTDDQKELERSSLTADDFYEAVGNLEERNNVAFRSLGAVIDGDKLLVSVEQDELCLALKTAHAAILESLKAALTRFDRRQETMRQEKEKTK